jgi:hypothetical protein
MRRDHALIIIFLMTLLTIGSCLSGQTQINGVLKATDTEQPIEFCAVVILGKSFGTYTNSGGQFSIPGSAYSLGDTIRFSYLGYQDVDILVGPEPMYDLRVDLSPSTINLDQVEILRDRSTKFKKETTVLGQWRKRTATYFSPTIFDRYLAFAQYVPSTADGEVYLERIGIYLDIRSRKKTKFLLDIYSLDPSCNCPGQSVLSSTKLIANPRRGWNDIDVQKDFPQVTGPGFFVVYLPIHNDEYTYSTNAIGNVHSEPADRHPIFIREGGGDWTKDEYMNRRISSMLVRATGYKLLERRSSR